MKALILLALVALAAAYDFPKEWQDWKSQFGKKYNCDEMELSRHNIWQSNKALVETHNAQADQGLHTYWLHMNEFADLANHEFVTMLNGYLSAQKTNSTKILVRNPKLRLPDSVDWRTKGYVTKVKNQGQCGSCWSFSATGSLEGQHFKKSNDLVSLSEQNLCDCSTSEGNHGCQGGLMDNAFRYIQKNDGIDTEESYPYQAHNERCRFKTSDVGATVTGFVDIKRESEDSLQQAVATIGPISVAIDASHSSFQLYHHGVYYESKCSETRLDHGVLAVGYGTESSEDYWLVKNSWGSSWGMDGYINMSRNKKNNCGIATQASYPTV